MEMTGTRPAAGAGAGRAARAEVAAEVAGTLEDVARAVRQLPQPDDLSMVAVATLVELERLGPRRVTSLAIAQRVTQPAMTQLISRFVVAGLVRRAADPTDGRVVLIQITDRGRETLAARRASRTDRIGGLLDALADAERAALVAALPALRALAEMAADISANSANSASSANSANSAKSANSANQPPGAAGGDRPRTGVPA
jgi:DNA-binding MarR family transcriptional regulator